MPTKIFAGNLPLGTSISDIKKLFSVHGQVNDANVIDTYAFIHFENEGEAKSAIAALHRSEFSGRMINVEMSKNQKSDSKGRPDDRDRDRSRSRRSRSRERSRSGRMDRSRDRNGGILPNPLGALAGGLGGLGGLGALPSAAAFQAPMIQPPIVQRDPQHEKERPNPDVRVRREAVHVSHVPGALQMGLTDGFVVYERYYVDPKHPLLHEQAAPRIEDAPVAPREEPRVYDSFVTSSQDSYAASSSRGQQDSYASSRQQDSYSASSASHQRQELVSYPGYIQQGSSDPYTQTQQSSAAMSSYHDSSKNGYGSRAQQSAYNPYSSETY